MQLSLPRCPTCIVGTVARASLGLSLLFVGLVHYMTFESFVGMVSEDLGALTMLGVLWAYLLPALMIVGGALLVLGMFPEVATWAAAVAIGSIPAGMLLKSVLAGVPLSNTMPAAINAIIWLIALILVVKLLKCCCSDEECCTKK
ncbi:MAG TPA: hypothetical protein DEB30_01960 [Candidatus Peribacter riflensis]|uniref:Uncharacterized protein n=1 Tax=Candidatus Peribacter riflensis TaxID=1735162 RepID=A0A0S1SP65_9BACT|nr:MAG: hypothetical protein PeribacterA2_0483 [Candidatus Peribacter riflensis]OGJ79287.1 MAG: hypothetical protein A2398_00545 [Candidatus Peribacteria bacterium RIFOXYB1_FULL_57_12]OGJ82480.1 MAG: hypothetical protein A2412_03240 [Candidatus Peribacteria bacterium RIFOXYC1_FULL_58_8]ALM10968.1 MAG: hypothetical protein PeribacterB2_0482 [Candidatus Peribacter riflensis]ALM12071.1 MAG: hypothetical protein PeribacterC2_0482 [Candidatus Peribacter riflensis]